MPTVNPLPQEVTSLRTSWDAEAEHWLRFARTPGHDISFWQFGLPHLTSLMPAGGRLTVDLGCGEGRLSRLLHERGHTVIGIDASFTLARAAVEEGSPPCVVADAARLPLAAGCADLIVAYMALHDFDDLHAAVAEAARVLAPRGRLCFAMLHPISTSGTFSERTADAPFEIEASYLDSRRFSSRADRDGIPMTFHSMHRPLGVYFDALSRAGFVVEALLEPTIPSEFVEKDSSEIRWQRLPLYLFGRALKV
jgi:SAM-dependent methyltransferase